jgi:hypothetical protein
MVFKLELVDYMVIGVSWKTDVQDNCYYFFVTCLRDSFPDLFWFDIFMPFSESFNRVYDVVAVLLDVQGPRSVLGYLLRVVAHQVIHETIEDLRVVLHYFLLTFKLLLLNLFIFLLKINYLLLPERIQDLYDVLFAEIVVEERIDFFLRVLLLLDDLELNVILINCLVFNDFEFHVHADLFSELIIQLLVSFVHHLNQFILVRVRKVYFDELVEVV